MQTAQAPLARIAKPFPRRCAALSPANLKNSLRGAVSANIEPFPGRSRGRPSLYEGAYCERVLKLAADGCGKAEIAAALSVSRKTLDSWARYHDDFREAMSRAKDIEYAWWLAAGRKGQFIKGWNATSSANEVASLTGAVA